MDLTRFKFLVGMHKPGETKMIAEAMEEQSANKEQKVLSPEARIHIELHDWAKSRACQDVFLVDVLRPAADVAKKAAIVGVANHAITSFNLGYLKCAEDFLEKFEDWARQAAPQPAQED